MYYQFNEVWDDILPDGGCFCHWGGKDISTDIIKKMNITYEDRILELCCGKGGTLGLVPDATLIVGLDISPNSIAIAEKHLLGKEVKLICADAASIPFRSQTFSKIIMQDGDVWMRPQKKQLMDGISKILQPKGTLALQNYCATEHIPVSATRHTERLLENCGYGEIHIPSVKEIIEIFEKTNFDIQIQKNLHGIYQHDNIKMLENLDIRYSKFEKTHINEISSIVELLNWEQQLFSNGWWTGILIIAQNENRPDSHKPQGL